MISAISRGGISIKTDNNSSMKLIQKNLADIVEGVNNKVSHEI